MRRNSVIWSTDCEEKKKEESGESLKDGLSIKKPLRGEYESIPGQVSSTDYHNPLNKGE